MLYNIQGELKMANKTQDLEQMAREALGMITRHGVDGSSVDREALNYGLEHGLFDQSAIDDAQIQYEASHPKK